jgi:hypothetical protein
VVANCRVGLGGPLAVKVKSAEVGDGTVSFTGYDAGRIVNRWEVEYRIPCVELMKTRK